LQELLKQAKIVYQTSKSGADHKPTYKTNVFINDVKMGKGIGSNKRESEEMAANQAINNLKQV
jgi:dsRNA-specific ribonuclease